MGKIWTKEAILESFEKYNRKTFLRVIGALYEYQTQDEQQEQKNKYRNKVGFNAADAKILTDMYQKGMRYGQLTEGQFLKARHMMKKYAGQLARIANNRRAGMA